MAGIFDWLSRVVSRPPAEDAEPQAPPRTEAGRYSVVIEDVGPDARAVSDALLVITPLELSQVDDGLESLPFTVRIGLTHSAARSIRDRLASLGARVVIEEFGD